MDVERSEEARGPVSTENWTPMPYVLHHVTCHMCFLAIPFCRRGDFEKTERTRAFYQHDAKIWECLACHAARQLSDLAGSRIVAVWRPAPVSLQRCMAPRPPMPVIETSAEKPSDKPSSQGELLREMTA